MDIALKPYGKKVRKIFAKEYDRIIENFYYIPKPKLKLRYYPSGTLGSANISANKLNLNVKALYDMDKNMNREIKRILLHEFAHFIIHYHFREFRRPSHSKYFWSVNWLIGNKEKNSYGYGKTNNMKKAEKHLKKVFS